MSSIAQPPVAPRTGWFAAVRVFAIIVLLALGQSASAQSDSAANAGPPSGMPQIPNIPGMPNIPDMGSIPGMPNIPNMGTIPNIPGMPNIPNIPTGPMGSGGMPAGAGNVPGMPDMSKMEAMQKQGQQMQVAGMLMGIKNGMRAMGPGIKMLESQLARLEKQGVTAPQELKDAIAKVKSLMAELSAIKSADDVTDADALTEKMSEFADAGSVLQDWGPRLGDLARMGQMLKQADQRLKQVQRDAARAKAQAAKSKLDLTSIVTDLDTTMGTLASTLADAKTKTDVDEKQTAIDSYFDDLQKAYDAIKLIAGLQNVGREKARWSQQIAQNDRDLAALKRHKVDTTELEAAQGELKAKLNELAQALVTKPIDEEAIVAVFDDLRGLQGQFVDAKDAATGVRSDLPQVKVEQFKDPGLNFSAFDQYRKEVPAPPSDAQPPAPEDQPAGEPLSVVPAVIRLGAGESWEGVLPAEKALALDGRIEYAKAAGANYMLAVSVNGTSVTSPLVNKQASYTLRDGRTFAYLGKGKSGADAWELFYSPDFSVNNTGASGGYQVMTDPGQAYHYGWDISSLAGSAKTMKVKLTHNASVSAAVIIQNLH